MREIATLANRSMSGREGVELGCGAVKTLKTWRLKSDLNHICHFSADLGSIFMALRMGLSSDSFWLQPSKLPSQRCRESQEGCNGPPVISDMALLKLACALTLSNTHIQPNMSLVLLFTFKLVKWLKILFRYILCFACHGVQQFVYTDMTWCIMG